MRAHAEAVLVGTEPWQFKDEDSGELKRGTSALFVTPDSVNGIKLTLPGEDGPAPLPLLVPMAWYELVLDVSKRATEQGNVGAIKLVALRQIEQPGTKAAPKAA